MKKIVILSLDGRIGRREYAVGIAAYLVLMMALRGIVPTVPMSGWYALAGLFLVASAVIVSMTVRRLHDIGRPGWGFSWTSLPLCEAAAIVGLTASPAILTLDTTRPYIVLGVTVVFAIWGMAGTSWLLSRPGNPAANVYGPAPGEDLPDMLVAGGARIGLFADKTIARGTPDQASEKRIRRGGEPPIE